MVSKLIVTFSFLVSLLVSLHADSFTVYLDPEDKYELSWTFEDKNPTSEVTFTVKCETTGWVGFGMSPKGAMTDGDIAVMWIDSDGKGHIQDMFAASNGFPSLDDSQDYTLISSSEADGGSTFQFKRKINTCDEKDNVITSDTTRIIYAYGAADPTGNEFTASDKHASSNRGSKSMYLLENQQAVEAVPDDALTYDMLIDKYTIPDGDTTYYCAFFPLPDVDKKHHVVSVAPIVEQGNEGVVHHILVYGCWDVDKEHIVNNTKTEGVCNTAEMPEFEDSCRSVVFAWAIGGTAYYFPEDAGYSLGPDSAESPQYFMMEVHYDNPQLKSGIVDSSGIRITYTPTLRDNDVGMLQMGSVYGIFVPPKVEEFDVIAYCHSSCTEQWVPEDGLNVFAYFLHSHLIGAKIKVEQYRNGKPLQILGQDNNYDFNYQEMRVFKDNQKLFPGDTLKITCTYNSDSRTGLTFGGLASAEEMCLSFLAYYPKQNVARCESIPTFMFNSEDKLYTGLGVTPNITYGGENPRLNPHITLLEVSDWTNEKVVVAQNAYHESWPYSQCAGTGSTEYEETAFDPSLYPTIEEVESEDPCTEPSSAGSVTATCISLLLPFIALFQ